MKIIPMRRVGGYAHLSWTPGEWHGHIVAGELRE